MEMDISFIIFYCKTDVLLLNSTFNLGKGLCLSGKLCPYIHQMQTVSLYPYNFFISLLLHFQFHIYIYIFKLFILDIRYVEALCNFSIFWRVLSIRGKLHIRALVGSFHSIMRNAIKHTIRKLAIKTYRFLFSIIFHQILFKTKFNFITNLTYSILFIAPFLNFYIVYNLIILYRLSVFEFKSSAKQYSQLTYNVYFYTKFFEF